MTTVGAENAMTGVPLRAPFPWFGGKRKVAPIVWSALGDVDNYVEPFAGSLAVLLGRPLAPGSRPVETVNDLDGFVANFWRALRADPGAVAEWADWPVNEIDLTARHLWLVNEGRDRLSDRLTADPDFYDAQVAGWWVWGICSWIGSGWCTGTGPWKSDGCAVTKDGPGHGVHRQLPNLGSGGQGVHRQLPHLGDGGQGVHRTRGFRSEFEALARRLGRVRVCSGDWSRVVTKGALAYGATVGVFLDPPYSGDVRSRDLYASDDHTVAESVRDWAIEHGEDPRLRIVLAGYEPEHEGHMPATWRRVRWSASAAYQNSTGGGDNAGNRHLERLWLSPGCLGDVPLFDLPSGAGRWGGE